jgi:hypothetical protein
MSRSSCSRWPRRGFLWTTIVCATVLAAPAALAQFASEDTRVTAPAPYSQGYYGRSVSVSGDLLAIGSPGDLSEGTVSLWRRGPAGWSPEATLNGADESSFANFGSVSASGDTVAVGARDQTTNGTSGGAVYVFVRSASVWSQQAKLVASDLKQGAEFGHAVALSGDTLVVGAYWADGTVVGTGAAYVFTRSGTTWTEDAKLTAFDGANADNFGATVAISGGTIVVGAPRDTLTTSIEGSAYVFVGGGSSWSLEQKLTASDASADDDFGASISLDGDRVAIGADTAGPSPSDESGAAYVFDRVGTTWSQSARLNAAFRGPFDRFGAGVSLQGDFLVVGAPHESATYLFGRFGATWYQRERLQPLGIGDAFGNSVSRDGPVVAVGAPDENGPGGVLFAGATYTYRFGPQFDSYCFGDGSGTPCPCGNSSELGQGRGCKHSGNKGARLSVGGVASLAADSVVLHAYDLRPTSTLFFQGSTQLNLGLGLVFGDGLRCAGAPLQRLGLVDTPGDGYSTYPDQTNTTPISLRGHVHAGEVKTYQVFYRDTGSFCTPNMFNMTNGVVVVWGP